MALMRPVYAWALGVSALATAVALSLPGQVPAVSESVRQASELGGGRGDRIEAFDGGRRASSAALPTRLNVVELSASRGDPFTGPAEKARSVPAEAPQVLPPALPPAPAQPPPANYRFLGQFNAPDGRQMIYLTGPDGDVQVEAGAQLKDGYSVERIDGEGIHLLHAATSYRLVIGIPPPPEK